MERVIIGKKLKELRSIKGITQKVIADYLNIRVNSYSQYENDIRQPDYSTLKKIAKYYNVSLDYMFGFEKSQELTNLDLIYTRYHKQAEDIFDNLEFFKSNKEEKLRLSILDKINDIQEIQQLLQKEVSRDIFKEHIVYILDER